MELFEQHSAQRRRVPRSVLWAGAVILVTALTVELSGTGVDILLLVLVGFFIILIERTIGDWLGELIGAGLSTILLGTLLGMLVWLCFGQGGIADRFLWAAAQRGYGTAYFSVPDMRASGVPGALAPVGGASGATQAPTGRQPAATSGSAARSPARTSAPDVAPPSSASENQGRPAGAAPDAGRSRNQRQGSSMRLDVPQLATTGEGIWLRVRVLSAGTPVAGAAVDFSVDGRALGSRTTSADGSASIQFSVRGPGRFRIAADFGGTESHSGSSAAATVTVLPGK